MNDQKRKIQLLNINDGVGNSSMDREKYQTYKDAILKAVPLSPNDVAFQDLPNLVRLHLPTDQLPRLGSIT